MFVPDLFDRNTFDDFFDFPFTAQQKTAVNPMKTDVKENENGYELIIDLPGIRKEDVKAHLTDGYLTISAQSEHNSDKKDDKGRYIRKERFTGSYSRSFYVGKQIKDTDIKARFENGVLYLDVPKPEALPKTDEKKYIAIE